MENYHTMNHIGWGIVGCGDVCEVKSGPGFQNAENSSLVAVMRRNAALAEDFARRHRVVKWYADAGELIGDPDVDAVYVSTPPSSHREYTCMSAEAGKPVYVEKPMALNYAECVNMIECCKKNNVPLYVAYYRRAMPRFLKIKSLLDDTAIGEVRFVSIVFNQKPSPADIEGEPNWRVDPAIAGGGYFFDLAPHMIDILQFLLGDIVSASGHVSNQAGLYEAEDTVSATFRFASGILGAGTWNFCAFDNLDRTEITGSKGRILFSTFGDSSVRLETVDGISEYAIENPHHIQQPLIQTVVDDLRGTGTCPSTGETGAKTNWVMDMIIGV